MKCRHCDRIISMSVFTEEEETDGSCEYCAIQIDDLEREDDAISKLRLQLADAQKNSLRYEYVRDIGFYSGVVNLGQQSDGTHFVEFECRMRIPEIAGVIPYEDEEWTSAQIDAAIDMAIKGALHD